MDSPRPALTNPLSSSKALPEGKRQHRSPALKRQIVEETLAPGASVARVARAHGVNANQVFAWRRQHREGFLEAGKGGRRELLAVQVAESHPPSSEVPVFSSCSGTILIELPKGQLRVTGVVDPEALRVVLKELLA